MTKGSKGALEESIKMLKYRERSRYEIETRLKQKSFPPRDIEEAVERLTFLGYLDDQRFAEAWIRNRNQTKPMGKHRLRNELKEKGVPADIIEDKIADFLKEYDERKLAESIIQRRVNNQSWRKTANFLYRRGFDGNIIKSLEKHYSDNSE